MSDSEDEPVFFKARRGFSGTQIVVRCCPTLDSEDSDDEPLFMRNRTGTGCRGAPFTLGSLGKECCAPRSLMVRESFSSQTLSMSYQPSQASQTSRTCATDEASTAGAGTSMETEVEPEDLKQDKIRVEYIKKERKKSSRPASVRETNKLKTKYCSPQAIQSVRGFFCHCADPCASKLDLEDIRSIREAYWNRSQTERTEFLVNKLVYDMNADFDKEIINFRYTINGKKVCGSFFRNLFPVSKQHFADIRKRVCERRLCVQRKTNDNIIDKKREKALHFLDKYVQEHGEPQPHKKIINLPTGVSKEDVYIEYLATEFSEMEVSMKAPAKLSYWYELWRTWRNQVKCPEWSTFSKCSTCQDIRLQMQLGDPTQKGKLLVTLNPKPLVF